MKKALTAAQVERIRRTVTQVRRCCRSLDLQVRELRQALNSNTFRIP